MKIAIADGRAAPRARRRRRPPARAPQLAELLGFDRQDQTRLATAVSEIARNAFRYAGGGRVEFAVEGQTPPQILLVRVSDEGPGIANLPSVLAGQYRSTTGMGIGIMGARRLMDAFDIESAPGRGHHRLAAQAAAAARRRWSAEPASPRSLATLARERADDPVAEMVSSRTRSCCSALDELRRAPGRAGRAEPRAGGHQPRRGGPLRRAGREGRPPAAGRRDEDAVPVQHEPRVPHAAELDPGADAGCCWTGSTARSPPSRRSRSRSSARRPRTCPSWSTTCSTWPRSRRARWWCGPASSRSATCSARCAACCGRSCVNDSLNLVFEDAGGLPPLMHRREQGLADPAQLHLQRAEVHRAGRGAGRPRGCRTTATAWCSRCRTRASASPPRTRSGSSRSSPSSTTPCSGRSRAPASACRCHASWRELLGGGVSARESSRASARRSSCRWPASTTRRAGASRRADGARGPVGAGPGRLPVLIVEDDPEMIHTYQELLRGTLFQLVPARSTSEARQILKTLRPRVIVLDVVLRGEDTWSLLAELKRRRGDPGHPGPGRHPDRRSPEGAGTGRRRLRAQAGGSRDGCWPS